MSWQDLEEARVVLGRPGLVAGTGITNAEKLDIVSRLAALEAKTLPPQQAITGSRFYGPLSTLEGYGPVAPFVLNQNILYISAFYCPENATFDEMRIRVSTAGTTLDAMRVGIYNIASNGMPSTLRADLGLIAIGSTTGEKIQPISLTLPRGLYWLGGFTGGVGIAIDSVNPGTSYGMTAVIGHLDTSGATPRASGFRATPIADGTLPTSFGPLNTHAPVPVFWLRAA